MVEGEGGLAVIAERNQRKADMLYAAIDGSGGFYSNPVALAARSRMNVPFVLRDAAPTSLSGRIGTRRGAVAQGPSRHRGMAGLVVQRDAVEGSRRWSLHGGFRAEAWLMVTAGLPAPVGATPVATNRHLEGPISARSQRARPHRSDPEGLQSRLKSFLQQRGLPNR